MAVRAIQARIECDRPTLEHLWRTHRVFNERLPQIIGLLFKMRRGECGDDETRRLYQRIGRFVIAAPSQSAAYLMNAVSVPNWKPDSAKKIKCQMADDAGNRSEVIGSDWADEAAALSKAGRRLFEKTKLVGDLPGCMSQMLFRESVAMVSGHDELTECWHIEHAAWLQRKAEWEQVPEHQLYLRVKPRFDEFENAVAGKASKRRGRWHLYLDWLKSNPDLAGWRKGTPVVAELTQESMKKIRMAPPWKQRSIEAQEFWEANPELAALDRIHGFYDREFVRRRKTKRNSDGFDHKPTFSKPHAVTHPRWFVFNAPQTHPSGYRELQLPGEVSDYGTVSLHLLTAEKIDAVKFPAKWVTVRFRSDPRLRLFRTCSIERTINRGRNKGQTKSKSSYEFFDRFLQIWRPAEISGIRLMFRQIRLNADGTLREAIPYLIFTCSTKDLPLTERAKSITWTDTGETTKTGKPRKSRKTPEGLISCAVDLGMRHVGFATICEEHDGKPRVLRSRSLRLHADGEGPELAQIGKHKREIRCLRRLRGKPVVGEESHVELQQHITHMAEDRFKKAARSIINFA